jgi:hypothetical protein
MLWFDKPNVDFTFEAPSPSASFIPVPECSTPEGAVEYRTYSLEDGKSIQLTLCFKAMQFPNGSMLVPFKVEDDGRLMGNDSSSPDVTEYTRDRAKHFVLSGNNQQAALKEWRKKDWQQDIRNLAITGGGCVLIMLISTVIGWVVRGFLQVPRGYFRPVVNNG